MTPLDWILSVIGLGSFAVFVGIIAAFVPQPDLIAVIAIALALAIYDFWIRPLQRKGS